MKREKTAYEKYAAELLDEFNNLIFNFEEDRNIDKHSLDFELEQSADLLHIYGEAASIAEARTAALKENIKVIESVIDATIRKEGGKITEAKIKNKIARHPEVVEASILYIKEKKNYEVLKTAYENIKNRKWTIESFFKMWISGYYSSPNLNKQNIKQKTILETIDKRQEELLNKKTQEEG